MPSTRIGGDIDPSGSLGAPLEKVDQTPLGKETT
jgi:hypothetical protein